MVIGRFDIMFLRAFGGHFGGLVISTHNTSLKGQRSCSITVSVGPATGLSDQVKIFDVEPTAFEVLLPLELAIVHFTQAGKYSKPVWQSTGFVC